MTEEEKKALVSDADGLKSYEYIANHIDDDIADIDAAIENMSRVDLNGQFLASAARYLHAISPEKFQPQIQKLIAATIERDREHRYLADILQGVYGPDYEQHIDELVEKDDNFRRIYKRLFPVMPI